MICENYTSSQELEEASLVECSSVTQLSQQLKSNPTASKSSSKGKRTASRQTSPSSVTSESLTEESGEEKLTSSPADSLAKTSASQVPGLESTAPDLVCGEKWPESLARYDQSSSSWRTHQCLLFEDLGELLATFPTWGTARDGECWEVTPQGVVQMESESGFSLMRPTASDGLRHKFKLSSLVRRGHQDGNLSEQLARVHQVKLTPIASEILMGFPETWTDLKPLEMLKWQDWQQQHGGF